MLIVIVWLLLLLLLRTNAGKLLDLFCFRFRCRSSLCRSFSAARPRACPRRGERCERRCEVSTASGCTLSASLSPSLFLVALSWLAVQSRGKGGRGRACFEQRKKSTNVAQNKKRQFHIQTHTHTQTQTETHTDTHCERGTCRLCTLPH